MKSQSSKLTAKQSLFVQEYLIDLNGTQAAIRAGYSVKTAQQMGSENLSKPLIAEKIQDSLAKREKSLGISAETVLKELLLIAKSDLAEAYDDKGNLKPIHEIPEGIRRSIAGIKVFEEYEGVGMARVKVGETRELKLWSKPDALEMLGRHLKLFTDKLEHHFAEGLAENMAKRRKRND